MKIGYGPALALAAACSVAAAVSVHAQGAAKPPQTVKPAAQTPPKAGKPPVQTAADGSLGEVVGTIADRKITFGEVVSEAQKQNGNVFSQTVAQLIGMDGSKALFGPAPKSNYAVTKSRVYALLREQNPPILGDTLKTMLEFDAVDRQVKKDNITITDAQIDSRINQFLKMLRDQNRIPATMTDDQFLAQNKVTRASLRKNFEIQAKLFSLIQREFIEKRLGHKLTPDDFFKSRHILIKVPTPLPGQSAADTKKADETALAKITQIAADIEAKKKTFEQAAKESTEDEGSKEGGGELGVQMRSVFVPEFEKAVFELKTGAVSKPVRSQFGYHIIQLEAKGAEIPEADRQTALDRVENQEMQVYLRELITTTYKTTNKLARPQQQMPFTMPQ